MKAAISAFVVIAIFAVVLIPQAEAQRAGFIVGIAPPAHTISPPDVMRVVIPSTFIQPFVTAPVQPFVTAPVQAFGANPFPPAVHGPARHRPIQIIGQGGHGRHGRHGGPATVIVQQPAHSHFFAAGPPPAPPVQPGAPLTFGTPRAVVVSRLGAPLVSVFTPGGETLYFNGGITVYIQNGQMARPR